MGAQTSEDELSEEADQEMEEMEDGVARFLEEEENDDDDTKEPENKNKNKEKIKNAVSKVKGLMTEIKEKANKNKFKFKFNNLLKLKGNQFSNKMWSDGHIPYSLQISNYIGHRTVETVKECNFFGPRSEFVISGSDCRHVFIWRKSDGEIVNILKGDNRITNVVQGNPTNCSLVTAGLDSTVKLFTPSAPNKADHDEQIVQTQHKKWTQIMDANKRESENSRRPIPMSLLVYLLRRGLYGFDTDDDEEDDDNNNNNNEDEDDQKQIQEFLEQ